MPVYVGRSGQKQPRNFGFSSRQQLDVRSHLELRVAGHDEGFGYAEEVEKEAILSRAFQAGAPGLSSPGGGAGGSGAGRGREGASTSRFTACCSRYTNAADDDDTVSMNEEDLDRAVNGALSRINSRELRGRLYLVLTDPGSSWAAWIVSVVVLFFIVLSSATFCLETVQGFSPSVYYFIGVVEWTSVMLFTLEYGLKLACAPNLFAEVRAPFNIIDLVAILPFYIGLIVNTDSMMFWQTSHEDDSGFADTSFIRVIRLVRVLRVLKLSKRISRVDVIVSSMVESIDMLVMLIFLLVLATVLCSTLIYYAETDHWQALLADGGQVELGPNGDPNPFGSIPECFWWCLVTLMTVGYGDVVPATEWGKLVACFTMLVSIIIMALPISVIGAAFTQQWVAYKSKAGVMERSERVWPRFQALSGMMVDHNAALEDFVQKLHNSTRHADVALAGFRHESDALMEHADVKCEEGGEGRGPNQDASLRGGRRSMGMSLHEINSSMENVTEHQKLLRQVGKAGFFANRSWHILNDMRKLSSMTQSEIAKIERAHFAYKSLKKWSDEGNVLQTEINTLLGGLEEVKSYLLEHSRQTSGSSKTEKSHGLRGSHDGNRARDSSARRGS
eukprot:jgi/Tetstr1/423976/TSEL_014587.t1